MKQLKTLMVIVALLLIGVNPLDAQLTPKAEDARNQISNYLTGKSIDNYIDKNDQSLNFKINNTLYYITIENRKNIYLFTFYRNGIDLRTDEQKINKENITDKQAFVGAAIASKLSNDNPFKAFVKGNGIRICVPVYAKNTKEFLNVYDSILEMYEGINLKKEYENAKREYGGFFDNIETPQQPTQVTEDTRNVQIVPQETEQEQMNNTIRELKIEKFQVRNVTADGKDITPYDAALRRPECQYLQEKVKVNARVPGTYQIGVKLYNPDGALMIPSAGAEFTTVTACDFTKANQTKDIELKKFGKDSDVWKAGPYKIEIYEGNMVIYTGEINIL